MNTWMNNIIEDTSVTRIPPHELEWVLPITGNRMPAFEYRASSPTMSTSYSTVPCQWLREVARKNVPKRRFPAQTEGRSKWPLFDKFSSTEWCCVNVNTVCESEGLGSDPFRMLATYRRSLDFIQMVHTAHTTVSNPG